MVLDPAQRQLIAELIASMRDDAAARERRWGQAYARARDSALRGRLLLPCGSWFHELELDAEGVLHVLLGDPPDPDAERPVANALEANFAWFGAVERFPELRCLLPARPDDAVTCADCGGTGVPPWHGQHPNVRCACGGAGWRPPGAESMEVYADGLETVPTAMPSPHDGSWWSRLRSRLRRARAL